MHSLYLYNTTKTQYLFYIDAFGEISSKPINLESSATEEALEFYCGKSGDTDYNYFYSMNSYIYSKALITNNKGNSSYNYAKIINNLCSHSNILVKDYPNKLVFKLPRIKGFEENLNKALKNDAVDFFNSHQSYIHSQFKDRLHNDLPYELFGLRKYIPIKVKDKTITITLILNEVINSDPSYMGIRDIIMCLLDEYLELLKHGNQQISLVCENCFNPFRNKSTYNTLGNNNLGVRILSTSQFIPSKAKCIKCGTSKFISVDTPLVKWLNKFNTDPIYKEIGIETKYSCCGHDLYNWSGYIAIKNFKMYNDTTGQTRYRERWLYEIINTLLINNTDLARYLSLDEVPITTDSGVIPIRFKIDKAFDLAITTDDIDYIIEQFCKAIDKLFNLIIESGYRKKE